MTADQDWYEMALGYEPDHLCCPDCGDDPADHTLHADGCRRVFPAGHPFEHLQFEPLPGDAWAPMPAEVAS